MNLKYILLTIPLLIASSLLIKELFQYESHIIPLSIPPQPSSPLNFRPVIGVLTQPSKYFNAIGVKQSYIASSYIKLLESAGAQVVPILYDYDQDTLIDIFSKVNGLFIPGGDAEIFSYGLFGKTLNRFGKVGEFLVNWVLDTNNYGSYYPLFGTCMGHEIITVMISQDLHILSKVNSSNHCSNLEFNKNLNISKIFHDFPQEILDYVQDQKGAYFNHVFAIEYNKYKNNDNLKNFFYITSYSRDKNNKTNFIASFEGKNFPVYSWQFHPEKSSYEWKKVDNINHGKEMIRFTTEIANFIVNEARKNNNTFDDETLSKLLINNYDTSRKDDSSFEQLYLFNELSS